MLDGIICIYILYRQEDVYVIDCPLVELVGAAVVGFLVVLVIDGCTAALDLHVGGTNTLTNEAILTLQDGGRGVGLV